jgi:hypothetical protein
MLVVFCVLPSAEQLRVKSGKTMLAMSAGKGISKLCKRGGWCEQRGAKYCSRGFA